MSSAVRTTCPDCGDQKLPSTEFTIITTEGWSGGQYRFKCGDCHKIVLKDASEEIIDLLRDAGVREQKQELPIELLERPLDGTLSEDDLIDLGLAFADGTAFDKITRKQQ